LDWCYIFYALYVQIAAVLLATVPRWFFFQALASYLLWVLPWAIAATRVGITSETAWTYYTIIFGGTLVFSFVVASVVLAFGGWRLNKGKIRLPVVQASA